MKSERSGRREASPSSRPTAWFACSSKTCKPSRRIGGSGGSGGGTNARTLSPSNALTTYRPNLRFEDVSISNLSLDECVTKGYIIFLSLSNRQQNLNNRRTREYS